MKILMLGDSITDMGRSREYDGRAFGYGVGYVQYVAGTLISENPEKYEIINRGISGNRVVDLYARIKCDVWNLEPDVLSIFIGVNDLWHEIGSKNGVCPKRFEKVYRMLIEDTLERLPNLKLLLVAPFVLEGSAVNEDTKEAFAKIKEYAAIVEKLAKEYGCAFLGLQEKFNELAKRHGGQYYLYDGVHPDAAGAKTIADEWLKVFRAEIDKN